jgi:tetratricopeptide (TPR) repeat protein
MAISFETPDFTDFKASIDKESKENLKELSNAKDPRIKDLIEKVSLTTDYDEIIKLCAQIEILDPESKLIAEIIEADTYGLFNKNKKADKLFKKIIKDTNGEIGYIHDRYGYFLFFINKFEESLECFEQSLAIDKNYVSSLNGKAQVLTSLGKYQDALECYDNALFIDSNHFHALNGKGVVLISLGKYQDALECFEKVSKSIGDNVISAKMLILKTITGSKINLQVGMAYYEELLKIETNDVEILNGKAEALLSLGKHQDALECFEQSLAIDKNYATGLNGKGHVLLKLEKHQDALECFEKVLVFDENTVSILSSLEGKADALSGLGKHQDALECYDKALAIDKKYLYKVLQTAFDTDLLNGKGHVLLKLEKHQDALECYDKVLVFDKNNVRSLSEKGFALLVLKKHQDALECFEQSLAIDKNNVNALNGKADALSGLGKHQDALECYDKVLAINKNNKIILNNKGHVLGMLGKYQDALECFEKARLLDNTESIYWSNSAEMLDHLKKYSDSITYYKKALSIEENEKTRKSLDAVIEKQNKIQNNAEIKDWHDDPATDLQRLCIAELGGDGSTPKTKGEASELITKMRSNKN